MSFSKTQKCIGVIAAVAVLGFSVAKADIRDTIQNAKSGTTVSCFRLIYHQPVESAGRCDRQRSGNDLPSMTTLATGLP